MKVKKIKIKEILRYLPILAMIAAAIIYFFNRDLFTAESLSEFAPENAGLAILFIMALAAAKSLSVFFPFFVIEVISTLLFSKLTAIIINIAAIAVSLLTAYSVGRCSGSDMITKLRTKYPKFDDFQEIIEKNNFFAIFALRIIGILPMDVVSMYFGATKTRISMYLLASLFGVLPDLILETLIGVSLTTFSSPLFFVAIGLRIIFSIISLAVYGAYSAKKRKKDEMK